MCSTKKQSHRALKLELKILLRTIVGVMSAQALERSLKNYEKDSTNIRLWREHSSKVVNRALENLLRQRRTKKYLNSCYHTACQREYKVMTDLRWALKYLLSLRASSREDEEGGSLPSSSSIIVQHKSKSVSNVFLDEETGCDYEEVEEKMNGIMSNGDEVVEDQVDVDGLKVLTDDEM